MDVILNSISEATGFDRTASLQIFVAVATVFVSLLFWLIFVNVRKTKKKSIFITGCTDAGKTALFFRLVNPKARSDPLTVTSQIANIFEDFRPTSGGAKNRSSSSPPLLRLIDIPGSDKVRSASFNLSAQKYPPVAGVVYVLDSGTVLKDGREVAQYLYELLADCQGIAGRRNLPVLIVCNKQDLPKAKSAKVVKSILEKEFTFLNQTRSAALDQTGVGGERQSLNLLGGSGTEFKFDQLPQKFEFVECTTVDVKETDRKADVTAVQDWLLANF